MRRARSGATKIIAIIVVVVIVIGGVLVFHEKSVSSGAGSSVSGSRVQISGAGSSFIAPQMQVWISSFMKNNTNIVINYNSVGSGAGVSQFLSHVVDFAGTDPPIPHDKWVEYKGKIIQMPVILGAVVVSYNLPGVNGHLNLTGEVIAKIYKGEIKYWDDPAIKELNPTEKLPHKEIIVVHRSDSSGTTNVFTLFLHKSAPSIWPQNLVGKTISWPIDRTGRGEGGKGNEGVASILKTTPYSIGYIELSYALNENLPYARIANSAGKFMLPTPEAIQAAARAALKDMPSTPLGDYSNVLYAIVYANSTNAYPISTFSFLVFWTSYPSGKAQAIKDFIKFINNEGQKEIIPGYVPIPNEIAQLNLKAVNLINATG